MFQPWFSRLQIHHALSTGKNIRNLQLSRQIKLKAINSIILNPDDYNLSHGYSPTHPSIP